MTMQHLKFIVGLSSTLGPPSPYSLPPSTTVSPPPSLASSPAPSSCSASSPSSSSETHKIDELSEKFARMNVSLADLKDYCSAEPFELEAQGWATLYFENQGLIFQASSSSSSSSTNLKSCLKKRPVCFWVQNSSTVKSIQIPAGTPLPTFLLMDNIRSCTVVESSAYRVLIFPKKRKHVEITSL